MKQPTRGGGLLCVRGYIQWRSIGYAGLVVSLRQANLAPVLVPRKKLPFFLKPPIARLIDGNLSKGARNGRHFSRKRFQTVSLCPPVGSRIF